MSTSENTAKTLIVYKRVTAFIVNAKLVYEDTINVLLPRKMIYFSNLK